MLRVTWMTGKLSRSRTAALAAMLCLGLSLGCAHGVHANSVPHCELGTERPDAARIDDQLVTLEETKKPSGEKVFAEILDYYDSLEAYCIAVNEARGD